MWQNLKMIIKNDRAVARGLIVGGLLVFVQIGLTLGFVWRLPPEIPLYYSQTVGDQQLARSFWFLLLPVSGLIFYLIQFILLGLAAGSTKVLGQIVVWLTNVSLFLITLAMFHILMLVF